MILEGGEEVVEEEEGGEDGMEILVGVDLEVVMEGEEEGEVAEGADEMMISIEVRFHLLRKFRQFTHGAFW